MLYLSNILLSFLGEREMLYLSNILLPFFRIDMLYPSNILLPPLGERCYIRVTFYFPF